ncbi:MAG: hypothetical protein E6Q37_01600 [Crocinitomicaceae bacterium]|nr:MAG: hypothetical protein E6Q37_01600 [Crocinitomicaceae bacterium]
MKTSIILFGFLFVCNLALADLILHPVTFKIDTDKESYFEGEKITFHITITNTDTANVHPVLLPFTQNVGQKLFYLNVYDKANNTMLLRYTEDRMLKMMVHDTGAVQIKYLKPLEQIVVPIYLNDSENYYNYHTQNASHHSFGVPLFAGVYKVNVTYNPRGIALGDSIYNYYNDFDKIRLDNGKQLMPEQGQITQLIALKIKRSADSVVTIERNKFFVKTDGYMYYYFSEYVDKITTDVRCIHITSLPSDSCSLPKGEYFYNQFPDLFNEYIARFDDGDIREYRKFTNWCPEYLYTERYNELKQKTHYELQLPNKSFYHISYHQPSGKIHQETYCSEDGTLCNVTTYLYNKKGEFVTKKVDQTEPCSVVIIDGKKRSAKRGVNLEAE